MFKNTLYNFLGQLVPALIALPMMGLIARMLNAELFGVFLLILAFLGYTNIFDVGISRSVIHFIALCNDNKSKEREVLGTSIFTVLLISVFASLTVYGFKDKIVCFLNVTPNIYFETIESIKIVSFIIPFTLLSLILFAYPQGRQDFFSFNIYKCVSGVFLAVIPYLFLLSEQTLSNAVLGLLLGRILSVLFAFIPCYASLGLKLFTFSKSVMKDLFAYGGWVTVSNLVSPMMVYADRFILSNIMGAATVAYYTAPAEAVTRMSILPGALSRTLFPLFSRLGVDSEKETRWAYRGMLLSVLTVALPVFLFSEPLLGLWLGAEYGEKSSNVFRILILGYVFNSLAQIPFSKIQALGRSRMTAMLHLIELFPYLILLSLLVYFFGITGAAIAWTTRVIIDFILLEKYSKKMT